MADRENVRSNGSLVPGLSLKGQWIQDCGPRATSGGPQSIISWFATALLKRYQIRRRLLLDLAEMDRGDMTLDRDERNDNSSRASDSVLSETDYSLYLRGFSKALFVTYGTSLEHFTVQEKSDFQL